MFPSSTKYPLSRGKSQTRWSIKRKKRRGGGSGRRRIRDRQKISIAYAMGAGGAFAAPSTPHEPNVGLVILYCVFDELSRVCKRRYATTMRGAGESLCGMLAFSTNIHGAAAFCRPNMPHTLRSPTGGVEAATAPSFMRAQGLVYATGTRALSPRDPDFPSFPEKRSKIRKAKNLDMSVFPAIRAELHAIFG